MLLCSFGLFNEAFGDDKGLRGDDSLLLLLLFVSFSSCCCRAGRTNKPLRRGESFFGEPIEGDFGEAIILGETGGEELGDSECDERLKGSDSLRFNQPPEPERDAGLLGDGVLLEALSRGVEEVVSESLVDEEGR